MNGSRLVRPPSCVYVRVRACFNNFPVLEPVFRKCDYVYQGAGAHPYGVLHKSHQSASEYVQPC
jgi:hypothetical protein